MTPNPIIIQAERKARLKWAFSTIAQFMMEYRLAVLSSGETGLVVTNINDCVLERSICTDEN